MRNTDWYKNNPGIKKKGVILQFTQQHIEEIIKCQTDITYFLTNYIYIVSLDKGKILFEPYDFQCELLECCTENRFSIFTLGRQLGKTITVCAFLLHQAIFNSDYVIAILANNAGKSREILSRLRLMYEHLPWWLKPGIIEWNKGSIEMSNGSKVFAGPTTASGPRGSSINILYLDEFAFVEHDVEFYTSTYPVISSGTTTKIIITSTPNGMNLFYKLWSDSINGKNEFAHKLFTWKAHPLRDEAWKQETIRNTSEKQFSQEHDCRFLGSSDTLLSGDALERLTYVDPIETDQYSFTYKRPEAGHMYVICVDVSEGIGKDYSTMQIIDVTKRPYEQVYIYRRNDISPWNFPDEIVRTAKKYNMAYLLVESNSVGKIVADGIYFEYDYDNMLSSKLHKGEDRISGFSMTDIGIKVNKKIKTIGCSALKSLIEENVLQIQDWNTVQELSSFVKVRNSYEAEKGKYDDLVMPLVHLGWLTTQTFFEDLTTEDMRSIMKERRELNRDDEILTFGFFSDGTENIGVSATF